MILSNDEARDVVERVLALRQADEMRVNLAGGRSRNTRFAVNSITTCGDADRLSVAVTAAFGTRHATAVGNELDEPALRRLVQKAEQMARLAPEDPEYVPELPPQDYLPIEPYFDSTANAPEDLGMQVAASAIEPAERDGLVVAGYLEVHDGFAAVGNSNGLFGYYRATNASYSVTARTKGGGSGYASVNGRDLARLGFAAASRRAIEKAIASQDPKTLDPGVYPVILEPLAVAEFLSYAVWNMSARMADEGRSFFAKPGGGNKIGEKIAGENITLTSDPAHADLLAPPFAGDGLPAKPRTWIERGVLANLIYDRFWATKQGKEPTGHPPNIILAGSESSLDDLIRSTDRALLVTRFWYIRSLDPQTILVTGLTRDGLFLVEDGQVKHAVKNFRFNESPIAVLNKVTALSRPERVGNALVPAIRASEFTFSSLSDAV